MHVWSGKLIQKFCLHSPCRDVLVIAVVDAITCLLAGFAIFSILGNLAENQGKDVGDVIQQGLCIYVSISRSFYNFLETLRVFKVSLPS